VRPGLSIPIKEKKLSCPESVSSLIIKSWNGSPGPASLGLLKTMVKYP
jgi:hypothetical protein